MTSQDKHTGVKISSALTVVVLTRPPGCVQVQPDWLTRRSQPSSSKQGLISHHCRLLTIRTVEDEEKGEGEGVNVFHVHLCPQKFIYHKVTDAFSTRRNLNRTEMSLRYHPALTLSYCILSLIHI